MINNRKGLSDVVTTVLIILLVLAAVAIIASYVLNVVNRGGTEIGGAAECTLMQLYPTECVYRANKATVVVDTATKDYAVGEVISYNFSVKATKRGADISVKQLDVLLQDTVTGDITKIASQATPKFLETSAIYSLSSPLNLADVSGAAGTHTVTLGSSVVIKSFKASQVTVTVVPAGGTASATCNPSKTVDCIDVTPTVNP